MLQQGRLSAKTLLHSVTSVGDWLRKTKRLGYTYLTSKAVTIHFTVYWESKFVILLC